ncbi:hypothetical protein MTR67_048355 [Solanum verrucosum]|uniref:Uncharacterized protein n=1 Tax=Solanum verrucosum TaxID=315347 RepID=A0AAF0UY84_SOLVR|nr:hypothetical protein MTR67_048355 [Solanum verrucosum]
MDKSEIQSDISDSMAKQEAKITYQDKATQTETEEEDTIEKLLKAITTLCIKVDSMDNEIQKLKTNEDNLKSKASQQHDYKNAELRRSEDGKNPELKGDDGKLLKTHNVCLNTAADCRHGSRNPHPWTVDGVTDRTVPSSSGTVACIWGPWPTEAWMDLRGVVSFRGSPSLGQPCGFNGSWWLGLGSSSRTARMVQGESYLDV